MKVQAPADVPATVAPGRHLGQARYFSTELTQLNATGGQPRHCERSEAISPEISHQRTREIASLRSQ
jgi:hypothetical protein